MIDPNSATGDGLIHWLFSACITILAAERAWMHTRSKFGYGRRGRSTFADHPEEYWTKMQQTMRESVSEPLARVLDKQTDILQKQIDSNHDILQQLARLDERTKRR